ncbi:MAG: glycerol-3-phosphate acyltransferase [Faecalibacterium prausnitzii]
MYHDDVRKYGSGAAGMTNMLRTFGKKGGGTYRFW